MLLGLSRRCPHTSLQHASCSSQLLSLLPPLLLPLRMFVLFSLVFCGLSPVCCCCCFFSVYWCVCFCVCVSLSLCVCVCVCVCVLLCVTLCASCSMLSYRPPPRCAESESFLRQRPTTMRDLWWRVVSFARVALSRCHALSLSHSLSRSFSLSLFFSRVNLIKYLSIFSFQKVSFQQFLSFSLIRVVLF